MLLNSVQEEISDIPNITQSLIMESKSILDGSSSDHKLFNNHSKDLLNSIKKLSSEISMNKSYVNESIGSVSLQTMVETILLKNKFSKKDFEFLMDTIEIFIDMLEFKVYNLEKITSKNTYEEIYENKKQNFIKMEQKFFVEIYKPKKEANSEFIDSMIRYLVDE